MKSAFAGSTPGGVAPMTARMALILAGVVIALWAPSLGASFQFDDWAVIVNDARVASLASWWHSMPAVRPLQKLVYALGNELGGSPVPHRAFNVLVHALNAVLVFVLARRLARRLRVADAAGAMQIGACTALLFALHPVQTEAVTYVSGGSQALSTAFALLTLLAFTRVLDAQGHPLAQCAWLALTLSMSLGALAVRETAIVVPFVCALWWAAEGGGRGRAPWFGLALMLIAAAAAVVAAWTFTAYPYLLQTSLETRSPLRNLLVQGDAIAWLLGQLIRWDRLNADPALVPDASLSALNLARVAILIALIVAAAWQWRTRRWFAFGVLWFFLWLAPTHSLLARLDVANERHLYVALVGPAWLLAIGLQRLRTQGLLIAASLAVGLALATAMRNRVYDDEVAFWQDVVEKAPDNARAANNLGMALAAVCQPMAAAREFEEAARLAPDDPRARINAELLARGELPAVPAKTCAPLAPSPLTVPSAPR